MTQQDQVEVQPLDFLQISRLGRKKELAAQTALIILNQPIAGVDFLNRLWTNSSYRIAADGGANRLYDLFVNWETTLRTAYLPDKIHGDLDSLRKDVGDFYVKHKTEVTQDDDQYSTDFGKCIKEVFKANSEIRNILVLGSLGGRVDQGIGLLGELLREQRKWPDVRFWLHSESSISFTLNKGTTVIQTPLEEGIITPNIGVLPVYGPGHITTKGLEWDVESWPTQMGGQMSTSNHIKADTVSITTDTDMLFTVERAI